MSKKSEGPGLRVAKEGPQGTQAFSREQLAELLDAPVAEALPAGRRASLVRLDLPSASSPALELHSDRMTLGRAATCELRIEEPSISSEHARLVRSEEGWRIVNLLSTNGVFVNNKKVFSQLLQDGDEIRLGRVRLRFVDSESRRGNMGRGAGRWIALLAITVVAAAAIVWLLQ